MNGRRYTEEQIIVRSRSGVPVLGGLLFHEQPECGNRSTTRCDVARF